ncbi:MAG: DUF2218 domain-containing protein [Nostocoides sp.]
MTIRHGSMSTDRPDRYAKQLAGHWSRKANVEVVGTTTTITFDNGQTVRLIPAAGELQLTVQVPEGGDADRFAQVVADHLQRFATREELVVTWAPVEAGG